LFKLFFVIVVAGGLPTLMEKSLVERSVHGIFPVDVFVICVSRSVVARLYSYFVDFER